LDNNGKSWHNNFGKDYFLKTFKTNEEKLTNTGQAIVAGL
jgi:hypothetical protein